MGAAVAFDEKALVAVSARLMAVSAEYMKQEAARPTGQAFARWLATNRPGTTAQLLGLFFNALEDVLRPALADVAAAGGTGLDDLALDSRLSERQAQAVRYMRKWGRISNGELRKLYPELTSEALRYDLADLVRQGIAVKIGDKRGAFYMLRRDQDDAIGG